MSSNDSPRFIVTGGAGFIGSNLVAALNARGYSNITVVDELDSDLKKQNLDALSFDNYLERTDFRAILKSGKLEPVDTVFHLGACSSTTMTDETYLEEVNVNATRDLCEWCLERNVRFIYASSAATYGDGANGYSDDESKMTSLRPMNLYGWSKQMFDIWARDRNLLNRIAGIKYFNVYGPGEDHKGSMRSLVNKAYDQIMRQDYLELFESHRPEYRHGEQKRDFVYVKDAVDVTLFFYDNPGTSGIFNCGTGEARTWLDLGKAIFAAMHRAADIRFVPMPESIRPAYQYFTQADVAKLRNVGYTKRFTSIEDGVRDYVEGYLSKRQPV